MNLEKTNWTENPIFLTVSGSLIGIILTLVAAIIYHNLSNYNDFIETDLYPIFVSHYPVILIVAGCTIFFLSFLCFYGTTKENSTILLLFIIASSLIWLLELSIIVVTILKKIHLDEHVDRRLRHMFKNIVDEKTFFQFWRTLQIEFKCCGIYGPWDWKRINFSLLPYSCCERLSYNYICNEYNAFEFGCKSALLDAMDRNLLILVFVAIGIAISHFLVIVLSYRLFAKYRKNDDIGISHDSSEE